MNGASTLQRLTVALADRYRVDRELGAGGMATVYLAHDLRHEREVAIKVLHPDLGAALGADRFLAEIKTTAKLQHPHILPLLDSGAADGLLYYVMPYVRGETLRARLERERQLPIPDALRIAREVAAALDHAHKQGIIHRDIKPENILLQDGAAVVADFGIALAVQTAGGARMTQTGLSLGTPQYMSPEQAMGEKSVDARSDIYALGAVTYEMLAGEPPFTGPSPQAIVAKVLSERPVSLTTVRDTVTASVDTAVRDALAKLPADRPASVLEFAARLDTRIEPATAERDARVTPSYGRRFSVRTMAVAVLTTIIVTAGISRFVPSRSAGGNVTSEPIRFAVDLAPGEQLDDQNGASIAVSPDGRTLAWMTRGNGSRELNLRGLSEATSRRLAIAIGVNSVRFSPDGQQLLLRISDSLVVYSLEGRPERTIARDASGGGYSWDASGVHYIAQQGLVSLSPDGRTRRVLVAATPGVRLEAPWEAPASGQVVFRLTDEKGERLAVVPADSGAVRDLGVDGLNALAMLDDWLLFGRRDGNISAVRANLRDGTTSGSPVPLLDSIRRRTLSGVVAAVSPAGTAMFVRGNGGYLGLELPVGGVGLTIVDERGSRLLTAPRSARFKYPAWSPDGRQIALVIESDGPGGQRPRNELWQFDVASRQLSRLSSRPARYPAWSRDGRNVIFSSDSGVYRLSIEDGTETRLVAGNHFYVVSPSPDGRSLVAEDADGETELDRTRSDVVRIDLGRDSVPVPIANTPALERSPTISPDGRWLAYESNESGVTELYVRPLDRPGGRLQVTAGRSREPRWGADSRTLYIRPGRSGIVRVRLAVEGALPRVVSQDTLLPDDYRTTSTPNYDVSPDGSRFVMVGDRTAPATVSVIVNWLASVRNRLR